MTQTWKVIYENGVFRPLDPIDLPENQIGTVIVEFEVINENKEVEKPKKTAYDLAVELGILGMIEGTPSDLSTNPKYMEGFGEDAFSDID